MNMRHAVLAFAYCSQHHKAVTLQDVRKIASKDKVAHGKLLQQVMMEKMHACFEGIDWKLFEKKHVDACLDSLMLCICLMTTLCCGPLTKGLVPNPWSMQHVLLWTMWRTAMAVDLDQVRDKKALPSMRLSTLALFILVSVLLSLVWR